MDGLSPECSSSLAKSYESLLKSQRVANLELKQQLTEHQYSQALTLMQLKADNRALRRHNAKLLAVLRTRENSHEMQQLLDSNSRFADELAASRVSVTGASTFVANEAEYDAVIARNTALEREVAYLRERIEYLSADNEKLSYQFSTYSQFAEENDVLRRENARLLARNKRLVSRIDELTLQQDILPCDCDASHAEAVTLPKPAETKNDAVSEREKQLLLIKSRIYLRRAKD